MTKDERYREAWAIPRSTIYPLPVFYDSIIADSIPTTPKQLPAAKSPTILAGTAGGYSALGSFPEDASKDRTPEYDRKLISWPAYYDNFDC